MPRQRRELSQSEAAVLPAINESLSATGWQSDWPSSP